MSDAIPYKQIIDRVKSDIGWIAEQAHANGYNEAKLIYQNPNAESDFQNGLNTAWDVARKIVAGRFSGKLDTGCILNYTASEAIEKIKAYEERQKADAEIKVGDKVKDRTDDCGVVTWIYGNDTYVLWQDGSTGNYAADELIKTGRHFNFLASLLEAMKEGAK